MTDDPGHRNGRLAAAVPSAPNGQRIGGPEEKRGDIVGRKGRFRDLAKDLPKDVSEATTIYLRPLELISGEPAQYLRATGNALPLAAGRFAFATCEVVVRRAGRIARHVVPVTTVQSWVDTLERPAGERVAKLLERLTAPRTDFADADSARPLVMGIVNVTPDSFSDGGDHFGPDVAIAHARRLARDGADIIDVGGESTRPGATPVEPAVECARVLPVIRALAPAPRKNDAPAVSVDTRHTEVMEAALAAGATIVNDVTALTGGPRSLRVAAAGAEKVVLMHMQGEPATMNAEPTYDDVVLDIFDYLEARITACVAAGVARNRVIADPGIGFGKSGDHNLAILRSLAIFHSLGCPVMVGVSRKGLTGAMDRQLTPKERLPGSLAAELWCLNQGAQVLRVHDVAETLQAIEVWDRLTRSSVATGGGPAP